jgi:exosome complex exonuclease DIS3/RRP44
MLLHACPAPTNEPSRAPDQVREANQMVEEMMLLANVTVAEHILTHFAACALLRRHAVPPPRQFEPLLRAAAAAGVSIDVASSKVCSPHVYQTYTAAPS